MPQRILAQTDYKSWYPFRDAPTCLTENGNPYIRWTTVLFNDEGADEGFYKTDNYNWGLGIHIGIGNQSQSQYKYAGNICCDDGGGGRGMYNVYNKAWHGGSSWWTLEDWTLGGKWRLNYNAEVDGNGNIKTIIPQWLVPFDLLNTKIKVRLWGTWWYRNKSSSTAVDVEKSVNVPYVFTIRQINWDANYVDIAPDGTVTVPYNFETNGKNTDGRTHICTRINNKWNSTIGFKNDNTGNYNAGTYTFKLSDIGMNMRSQFTIEPYHEFTHAYDLDANNGTKYYTTSAGSKTFAPMPVATINSAVFNQADKTVTLNWKADNGNFATGGWGARWIIYRNGTYLTTINQDQANNSNFVGGTNYRYVDTDITTEQNYTYTIYYVWKGWPVNAQVSELKSNDYSVSTARNVPVNNIAAVSEADRMVLTWTSDAYEANWCQFKVFIDDETKPVCTISPIANQTKFQWEHRYADQEGRTTGTDNGVPYAAQKLNGCEPHNYRVEAFIAGAKQREVTLKDKGIGSDTRFVSFKATKGVYPGTVKLAWQVDQEYPDKMKTYIVQRRTAERENEAWTTLYRTSSNDEYMFYTDETPLPGVYYDYLVTVQDKCDNKRIVSSEATDVGFAQTTGTVSGRITYGTTGMAVDSVDVEAQKTGSSGEDLEQFHAMYFDSTNGVVTWEYPSATYAQEKFSTGDFSIQMWIKPEAFDNYWVARFQDNRAFGILNTGEIAFCDGSKQYNFGLYLKKDAYNHVAITRTGNTVTAYLVEAVENGKPNVTKSTKTIGNFPLDGAKHFELGYFKGFADELRLWTKCLTENEIVNNFDRLLVGNEKGLETYWTFDEGLTKQFFDYSREGTVYHEHHGTIGSNTKPETDTPGALKLKAKADLNGNYIIMGVPFSGEGTTYAIIPSKGIHQFNPQQHLRYVGNNSLVHNGVDFDDVSSFKVTGSVFFENTTIPVADAYLYIDGIMAAKDGEPVMTNSLGQYEISVPIGDHFIQVKKQGHTFLNGGRYPNDPDGLGLRETFEAEKKGLTFYDQTTVTIAGRVAGGDIEYEKPLGLGLGKNNIGKAKLQLQLESDKCYLNADENNDISKVQRNFETASGAAYVPAGKNYVVVETDSITGEWVAQLLPLRYNVTSVQIPTRPTTDMINTQSFSLPIIDATNPDLTYTDSIEINGEWKKFEYVASAKMRYKSSSTIEVTENADGSFGMKSYKVKDVNDKEHEVNLYTIDANGNVTYTFEHPVYQELSKYKYNLFAYEMYKNYDSNPATVDQVPLAGKTVTIKNQFASTTAVKKDDGTLGDIVDDKFELNDEGKAVYQFTVGFPNISSPYTRGMSISYDNNGTEVSWDGNDTFQVIVLGGLPTGNNFVTQGPDEVLMVLRDPPGTGSKATWNEGTTVTKTKTTTVEYNNETGINSTIYAGVEASTGAGIGFMVITDLKSKVNIKAGAEYNATRTSGNTTVSKTTATREISTSDAIDFVGAVGDVFIGSSKNIIFGACRAVDIRWNNSTNKAELIQDDAISMGEQFTTSFAYEQNYIKNVLIPNFETIRNSILIPVKSVDGIARPAKKDGPKYVTTLSPDDPRFGTSNDDKEVWGSQAVSFDKLDKTTGIYRGPSYTMILPENFSSTQDTIKFYNTQIKKWEYELYKNEESKVTAMNNRKKYLKENHSFSAGASVTQTIETEESNTVKTASSDGFNIILGLETGVTLSGVGIGVEVEEKNGGTWTSEDEEEKTTTTSISYTLAEDGDDDYLSVDVYDDPDGFGPIFVTRGGATSCPYEDEVVTEYYQPGTVISKKTVQIEKPEIEAQNQIITGIPAGGSGTFKVNIRNNSDTGEDVWFDLLVPADSNPDGLSVKIDDTSLNRGTTLLVKAGETMEKTITVSQTNPDILKYENVKIRIASQCQKDNTSTYAEIASTTEFSCYFQPSCSDIKLETSHRIVNTDTEELVTLSMSGYNYSLASLQGIRLQYKGINDADFRTMKEWMKSPSQGQEKLNALVGTEKLNYSFDLRSSNFDDKTYVFRAITVCDQGGKEVNNESDEITIIRDMSRPMLIATPSPASGILNNGSDLLITFNEDIQNSILTQPNNFKVAGVLNEGEVAHDVALSLSGNNTAKTEAQIDLNGKSFSTSMWVNYSTDGTLLKHGVKDNNFTIAIENGKLAVSVAGQKEVSELTLPKDKWLYLNVSYNAGDTYSPTPTLTAAYAKDADKVTLINEVVTKAYDGNGAISLGGDNLTAKIQELAIWDSSRSMAEAQATMYTTKSQFTKGLLGYWQMNEGHGSTATDKARLRHIILPSQNAWWINGANYALPLDGTKAAAINIGNLNTTSSEDYLIETWFKADAQQGNIASVLSTPKMDLRLNEQGKMEILLSTTPIEICNKDLRDGQWHHLAVSVLKSANGGGNIYIDGQQYKQIAASAMPELFGDKLIIGGHRNEISNGVFNITQQLKGAIDEVRIWKGRRTADVIKDNMYARVSGDEAGLVAYYPLEKNTRDEYNQIVAVGTLDDGISIDGSATPEALTIYNADGTALNSQLSTLYSTNTAALKQAPKTENVQFSFVASERQIKVNLEEQPERMEGCNIYVTVKNVKDLHGNSAEPITWGVYVQQNNLRWEENEIDLEKKAGEKATFTATIENRGSESETWSLSGLPSWLSVNSEGGTLKPLSTGTLTFNVSESLPTGKYEQTIYVTGKQNISEPLTLFLKVKAEEPAWSINPSDYENSMNVIGIVEIEGKPMNDEDDILAAFIDDECRGLAHLEYKERFDSYFVTMDIYGNTNDNKEVTFRAYDASTGTVYPAVEPNIAIKFEPLTLKGTYTSPVTFTVLDKVEQSTNLKTGWNWLSLNVVTDNMSTESIFEKIADDVLVVKSQRNGWLMYENGNWDGSLNTSLSNTQMYAVKMQNGRNLHIVGQRVNPADCQISLLKNWNWIGYYGRQLSAIDEALAGMSPNDGDILKAQSGVAYYDGNDWLGSIKVMEPGKGYMLNNTSGSTKQFSYPSAAVAGARRMLRNGDDTAATELTTTENASVAFTPVDMSNYSNNAIMTIRLMAGNMAVAHAEVGVFADDECRAASQTNGNGIAFLTIPGDDEVTLTFKVAKDSQTIDVTKTVNYEIDGVYGSPKHPLVIDLGETTGIWEMLNANGNETIYDISGRKLNNQNLRKGIYIINAQKKTVR